MTRGAARRYHPTKYGAGRAKPIGRVGRTRLQRSDALSLSLSSRLAPVGSSRSVALASCFRLPSRSLQPDRLVYPSTRRVTLPGCRRSLPPRHLLFPSLWLFRSLSLSAPACARASTSQLATRIPRYVARRDGPDFTPLRFASLRFATSLRDAFVYTVGNTEATRARECSFIGALSLSRARLPIVPERSVRNVGRLRFALRRLRNKCI